MSIRLKDAIRKLTGTNALLVMAALVSGACALVAVRHYLDAEVRRVESQAEARYRPTPVIVASRDIAAGQPLAADGLAVRHMPGDFLPAGAFPGEAAGELLGRRLLLPLHRGDPLTRAALAPAAASGLSRELPQGFRALTLAVDDIDSHAGLVEPGDEVDLYLVQDRGAAGSRLSLLLERVPVIATGARLEGGRPADNYAGYGTITLRASAADASRIILAQEAGALSVVLRAAADPSPAVVAVRDTRELLRGQPATEPGNRAAIEVLLGGEGGPEPRRVWLRAGVTGTAAGDRS